MKISIITVCYNSVATLEKTILSVLNQTYSDVEYIIIDGGSTDGTVEVIKKYADRLAYWVSEPDRGIYDAMNKGISEATGELIGIINSDDWYEENALSIMANAYATYGEDCLYHAYIRWHHSLHKINYGKPDLRMEKIKVKPIIYHPTLFVPMKIYKIVGNYDTTYRIAADYEFILRCYLLSYKFIYIDQLIANMCAGGESDRNAILGYKEVREIALKNGASKRHVYRLYWTKSFFRFIFSVKKQIL